MSMWAVFWLGIGVVLAIAEGLTVQFVAIWFAVSSGVTAIAAAAGLDFQGQLLLFVLLSFLLLMCTRPLLKRKLQVKKVTTNADMVIGKIGVVIQADDGVINARISVTGMEWSAVLVNGELLQLGQKVRVNAIEGVKLIVEPVFEDNSKSKILP